MSESRRMVLKSILVGAVAGTLPPVALGSPFVQGAPDAAGSRPEEGTTDALPAATVPPAPGAARVDAPWSLLFPAGAGTKLALGWTVESLSPVTHGAPILGLKRKNGEKARVYVCRSSETPVGVAQTKWLDFVLVNGGNGKRATDESIGRVLLGLAATIRRREAGLTDVDPNVALLKTNRQRMELLFGFPEVSA